MKTTTWLAVGGVVIGMGCAKEKPEAFFPIEEKIATREIFETQAARGARADGTLHESHFDRDQLNELGKAKLALMMRDNGATWPMVVYVAGASTSAQKRESAVETYLTDLGVQSGQFQIEAGTNPAMRRPAQGNISRINKTENPAAQQGAGDPSGEANSDAAAAAEAIGEGFGAKK